jgi:SAM-dependent methyltransferase
MRRLANDSRSPSSFYDERHTRGWMDYWSEDKLSRVLALVQNAIPSGDATVLEYGCGTGTFTQALKKRFPSLDVHGCDISPKGIEKAGARCPEATFHWLNEGTAEPSIPQCDVIYTHHVLEHVQDLDAAVAHIATLLRPGGRVWHILPCGNYGSIEYRLATLVRDGIATDGSGLFYLDDISHVRRLTSKDLEAVANRCGLRLECAYFANQFWGGLEYLAAQLYWGLFEWLNPARAWNFWAGAQLLALLLVFAPISILRIMPRHILRTLGEKRPFWKRVGFYLLAPFALMALPFSWVLDKIFIRIREWEWKRRKDVPNGGEMYLLFSKTEC